MALRSITLDNLKTVFYRDKFRIQHKKLGLFHGRYDTEEKANRVRGNLEGQPEFLDDRGLPINWRDEMKEDRILDKMFAK